MWTEVAFKLISHFVAMITNVIYGTSPSDHRRKKVVDQQKAMLALIRQMQASSSPPVSPPPPDAFWAAYAAASGAIHPPAKCARLRDAYAHAIHALFGVRTLAHVGLDADTPVVTRAGTSPVRVTFSPPLVGDVRQAQRDACLVLARVWRETDEIEVYVDLRHLTARKACALALAATPADVQHGLALWQTLPCRFRKIVIAEPARLVGWGVFKRCLPALLSQKLNARCVFESRNSTSHAETARNAC